MRNCVADFTTLWLTRHAESAQPTVFHGAESNIGLSPLGHRQAAAAAEWFRTLGPTAVVSSDMIRARETAAPIVAACGVPHHIEPDLHERRVGDLSGTSFSSESGPWHDTIHRWMAGEVTYTTPGAESFEELSNRLIPAVERIANQFRGERVVVVAHGVVCKVLLLTLLADRGVAKWQSLGKVANVSVSELRFDGTAWSAGTVLEVPPGVAALTIAPASGEQSQG
jgi:2,3-bisphosphoglycerate-dependent phosphoglycerate mutase